MIRIALIIMVGLMVSCHTQKKIAEEQPKVEPQEETSQTPPDTNEEYYLGVVQILDCGLTIQISSGDKKSSVTPVNLDPKFRVDNMRLKLKFKKLEERAGECSEFQAVEILEAFAVR